MTMNARPATLADLASCEAIAREVEPLFGPMPDFGAHVRRGVERGTVLVVSSDEVVVGAALLSPEDRPHHIHWLAVRSDQRRRGVGHTLLSAILERWPTGPIEVVTFDRHAPGGEPARSLYERFGFRCAGAAEPAPDGGKRDLFVLER